MYEIKTEDVYEDFSNNKEMFDVSNYSTMLKYYDNSNILVVGKMKDETVGVAIEELVGYLRHSMNRIQSKYYSTGTYGINQISLSRFDDKIYIQNNGYD